MLRKYLRYSDKALASLGLGNCNFDDRFFYVTTTKEQLQNDIDYMLGEFKDVIISLFDLLRDSPNLNTLSLSISPSAPKEVIEFANLVLHKHYDSLQSAPDSETAFNLIFPRNADFRYYAPFGEQIQKYISSISQSSSDS